MLSVVLEQMSDRRLELKYGLVGGFLLLALAGISGSHLLASFEDDMLVALEAALGLGLIGLFIMALVSNMAVIINIPFMFVALPWVLADPTPRGVLLFSLATGIGAGLGKLVAYALAARVASHLETLSDSSLHRWVSTQMEEHPRFAPALVFVAAGTIIPLDPALMPLLLVRYPARKVALPLLAGKVVMSLTVALTVLVMSNTLGMGSGMNIDLTFGVVIGTLLLVAYQIEKTRKTAAPVLVPAQIQ